MTKNSIVGEITGISNDTDKQQSFEANELVVKTLKEKNNLELQPEDIDIAYRLGRWEQGKNRPIIVKFVRRQTKINLMKKAKDLKKDKIFVNEDLSKLNQQVLVSLRLKGSGEVERCWSREGKLFAIYRGNTRPIEVKFKDYAKWIEKPWPKRNDSRQPLQNKKR